MGMGMASACIQVAEQMTLRETPDGVLAGEGGTLAGLGEGTPDLDLLTCCKACQLLSLCWWETVRVYCKSE